MAKFNEEICNCLTELYREEGLPMKYCADCSWNITVPPSTNWMEKGEKAKSGKYQEILSRYATSKSKIHPEKHERHSGK